MSTPEFSLRGSHVLAAMLAFMAAIIAVNIAFAIIAVRSFPGEDVRRSYLQGLDYNHTIAERRAQADLGWQASAALMQDGAGAILEVTMRTRDGAPLESVRISGDLRWPTDGRRDRTLAFESAGDGRFRARLSALPAGRWRLRARAEDAFGGALDFESDLAWQALR